jgi:hypothetical protein
LRINGRVEVRGVGVYEEVGRFGCSMGVVREPPFVSEPEDVVPNRVVLHESTGEKRLSRLRALEVGRVWREWWSGQEWKG